MIDIEYSTTPDFTPLNPPKFVKINQTQNTVLIPRDEISLFVQPTDIVSFVINNRTIKQKVGLDSGFVRLYNTEYYYFYIIPGFPVDPMNRTCGLIINNQHITLNRFFDSSRSAKLINGLLILPNNFGYAFNHTNYGIVLTNNKNIFTNILKQDNKYSYYMANTNNTLLYILDNKNTNTLYAINNTYDSYIRPLFNKNYPLGTCRISSKGVDTYRMLFGNNIFRFKDTINIDYLPAGQYKIGFLDNKDNLITINRANNIVINNNSLDITISSRSQQTKKESSILTSLHLDKPQTNYSNLTINLKPHNTPFELIGPAEFNRQYKTGFQQLHNILPGEYTIKYKNTSLKILVIKNDNNYFSNL